MNAQSRIFAFVAGAIFAAGCVSKPVNPLALTPERLKMLKQTQEEHAQAIESLFANVAEAEVIAVNRLQTTEIERSAILRGEAEIRGLIAAIATAVRENDGRPAMCFSPRHGIRLRKGDRSVFVVICFECSKGYIEESGESKMFAISRSAEKTFDEVFGKLGLEKVP